ncbi:capsid protein precursor [Mamastrovirus 13]|uniref:Capsid protein n=1 Tax=Ovine astrovirus 1 TaxID=1239577 RepID=A0A1T4IZ18_OASV1|nr:capsid protein precursor [Mamastrovirus 13]
MADKPQHKVPQATAKQIAKEVVKQEKKDAKKNQIKHQQQSRRNWQAKPRFKTRSINSKVKKELNKQGLEGPAARFRVNVSATIGKVGPNAEQGPELQIATFLHPSLVKEPNDGTNFGPLQAAAAQWGLWRISSLVVRFTPLVGPSAVTGSVTRASLNLTQSPGATSWGGLGARKHMDIPTGSSKTWKLKRGDLSGPRQTWWVTDTNEEGGQSCGPMLEVHGLGKTTSTYKDAAWAGDLFIVEISGTWEFTNYNAKPALGTLERVTDSVQVSLDVDPEGQITMTIPDNSPMARHMGERYERSSNSTSIGETIWQVVDEGAGLASSLAPAPFGWLIKGGWWFVKKVLGRASNAGATYLVYASLADAQNGKPAISTNRGFTREQVTTTLSSTQLNAPNTGPGASQPALAAYEMFPYFPHGEPAVGQPFYMVSAVATGTYSKAMPIWIKLGGPETAPFEVVLNSNKYYIHTYFKLTEPVVFGADIPQQTSPTPPALNGWYTLDTLPPIGVFNASFVWPISKSKYGEVIASTHYTITTISGKMLMLVAYLVRVTTQLPDQLTGSAWTDPAGNDVTYFTPLVNALNAAPSTSAVAFTGNRLFFQPLQRTSVEPAVVGAAAGEYILALAWCKGTTFSAGVISGYEVLADTAFNLDGTTMRADDNGVMTLINRAVPYTSLCTLRMTRGAPPTSEDELVARILGQLQSRFKFASGSGSSSEDDLSEDDDFECLRSTPLQQIYEGVRGLRGHAEAVAVVKSIQSRGHAE